MKRRLGAVALMLLALGATDAAAKKPPENQPRAKMTVGVLTLTQQEARRSGVLRVDIWSGRDIDVQVTGYIRGKHPLLVAPTSVVDLPANKHVNYRLRLTEYGRNAFARDCHPLTVRVDVARAKKRHPMSADRKLPSTTKCPGKGGSGGKGGGNSPGPAFTYSFGLA